MKQIAIEGKKYDIDCNAWTYVLHKKLFNKGIMQDIHILQNYVITQTIKASELKQKLPDLTEEQINEQVSKFMNEYIDDFIEANDLKFNQNQYDALLSYFYNNGAYVFSQTAYDSWIDQGGEKAKRAEARKELKEYLIAHNGNYNDEMYLVLQSDITLNAVWKKYISL